MSSQVQAAWERVLAEVSRWYFMNLIISRPVWDCRKSCDNNNHPRLKLLKKRWPPWSCRRWRWWTTIGTFQTEILLTVCAISDVLATHFLPRWWRTVTWRMIWPAPARALASWRSASMPAFWGWEVNWRIWSKLRKPMDNSGFPPNYYSYSGTHVVDLTWLKLPKRSSSFSSIPLRYEEELARQLESLEKYIERLI